jgi:hypothetical protein
VCFPAEEAPGREVIQLGKRLAGSHVAGVPTTYGSTSDCPGPGHMVGAWAHFALYRCRRGGVRPALTLEKDVVGVQGDARRGACGDELT